MYVGVIPQRDLELRGSGGIPHVCGGDPNWTVEQSKNHMYSPCMWG